MKKKETENINDSQPGPSGLQGNNLQQQQEEEEASKIEESTSTEKSKEKTSKEKLSKPKKKKKEKEKKVEIKDDSRDNSFQSQRRRSSSEQTMSRYKLNIRPAGHQRSDSLKHMIPKPAKVEKPKIEKPETQGTTAAAESIDRDHHAAIDAYFRSSGYTRESLSNLRKACKKESFWHLHRRRGSKVICNVDSRHNYHVKRCKDCFEPQNQCKCLNLPHKPPQSDWMTLIRPKPEEKTFTKHRLDWLNDLEENSKIESQENVEQNFDPSKDICCFPFSTSRIYSRRNVKMMDYYYKKPDLNKTPN